MHTVFSNIRILLVFTGLTILFVFGIFLSGRIALYLLDPSNQYIKLKIPHGFPYPPIPPDNQPTKERIALGKRLFSDPILSRDSTISCATCHIESKYFTDGLPKSKGIEGRTAFRNAPTLVNCAYLPNTMWDGGVPTLEQQVLAPISNPLEMDFDINSVVARLLAHPIYLNLFRRAYGLLPSVYTLTRAIACYERTLFSRNCRYDDFLHHRDSSTLSNSEKRGMALFFGERGECFHCHGEYNFTDYSFKNNGLYLVYPDSGRARITLNKGDLGMFRVPSLRNIALTAPYMHDGSLPTLKAVIDHYNRGGEAHFNKSGLLTPMHLSESEIQDLVAFLNALTDK
jgi:cytochrome c peroxidase